jgi:hypothetical protein
LGVALTSSIDGVILGNPVLRTSHSRGYDQTSVEGEDWPSLTNQLKSAAAGFASPSRYPYSYAALMGKAKNSSSSVPCSTKVRAEHCLRSVDLCAAARCYLWKSLPRPL